MNYKVKNNMCPYNKTICIQKECTNCMIDKQIEQELSEKDDAKVKDRKCKYCGATTKRTLYGLCSKCCRFN
jgi:hypothetical protein